MFHVLCPKDCRFILMMTYNSMANVLIASCLVFSSNISLHLISNDDAHYAV